jgi:nucleotide-binding universal stress UspA family protein
MRYVVVPLDGSELAERAVPVAERLARASGAGLRLIRASLAHAGTEVMSAGEAHLADDDDDYLLSIAASVHSTSVATSLVQGDPVRTIVDVAAQPQTTLVVMATHARSFVGRWLSGSVADQVVRHAEVPVVVVPPVNEIGIPWRDGLPLRILVTLDGSSRSEMVLHGVRQLAADRQAEVLLLRVLVDVSTYGIYPRNSPIAHSVLREAEQELAVASKYLEGIEQRLRSITASIRFRVVRGDPARMIRQVAAEEGIGLVAMATHGWSGLSRLVLGSVTMATLQRARLPILLVSPACRWPEPAAVEPFETQPLVPHLLPRRARSLAERLNVDRPASPEVSPIRHLA